MGPASLDLTALLAGSPGRSRRPAYRLIDACCQPHGHLDAVYASLEEALHDAIAWCQEHGIDPLRREIGVEVCTPSGDWRTVRLPHQLLCPLLCPVGGAG